LIVLDASALVEVILRRPDAIGIQAVLFARGETLHAPHFLDLEVTNVLRRVAARGEIGQDRALAGLEDLADMQLTKYPHVKLLKPIWALRHNFSVYDAAYVALAGVLGARLLTLDRRLAAAVREHTRVELVQH
jgi:predicted nucleic acid-binding protein